MTLERETRDAIGRTVRSLRVLFEDEFGKQASGRFGIRSTPCADAAVDDRLQPWLDPVESLSLTPAEFAQRDELIHALRYLTSEGHEPAEAVARLIRDAAFTAVNRLLAVRVTEAIGVLPPVLSAGRQSSGYRDTVGDLFPGLAHDEDSYWTYLQVAGDELAPGVPRLFDRRHPTSALVPSRACVDEALELLGAAELDDAWAEPETLGWSYQFFNGDDVKQMRDASAAPRNSRELAVRNQFFTPRYVVDWLVQNSLGRRLAQASYDLDLPLLVGEIGDHEPLVLDDVRVLDPAVGSGHFLLGSYDLLEQAWQSTGIPPEEAAAKILPCLFGVDIDPRAAQVAQAVLLLRARRSAPSAELTAPTIVTAVALPHSKELREHAFGNLSPAARHLADEITEALDQAPLLGSLLKVEQRLQAELASHRTSPRLAVDSTEAYLLDELRTALDELVSAAASPEERMFTADATDSLRFLEICQQRYDTVLMNPPFGDPIPGTKEYLEVSYPESSLDLYAAFVERGLDLLRSDGYVGAITSRTGFFFVRFAQWRDRIVHRLRAVADFGIGVMHDAMVEAAAYVLGQRSTSEATFLRLVDSPAKGQLLRMPPPELTFNRKPQEFMALPETPFSYWLPKLLFDLFRDKPPTDELADARRGAYAGDDFRYVRCWWEVRRSGGLGESPRWMTFAKGGEYSPYYAHLRLVVDWDYDRATFTDFHGRKGRSSPIPENRDYFGRPGLTWSHRSQKGFSVRPVPMGQIFGHKGPVLFVEGDEPGRLYASLAYLNSSLCAACLEGVIAFGSYDVGAVQRIPFVELGDSAAELANEIAKELHGQAERDELDHAFCSPWSGKVASKARLARLSREVDELVSTEAFGGNAAVVPMSSTYATQWFEQDFEPAADPGVQEELSYGIGIAFGRWDVRLATGVAEPPPMPGPFDPLPSVSRGMLVGPERLPISEVPDDYPVLLPLNGLLHDDPGHDQDIVRAIERAYEVLEASPEVPDLALSDARDLRTYVRDKFFAAHLKQYSASRRYAPIYWQLAVPSRRWGLWIYAPSLSRESLFAVARAAREKLSSLNDQISLARERTDTDRDARERAEGFEDLAAEVEKFAAIADEVAQSGWEPDPNDGFVLNAAPLEELFVDKKWRGQIAKHRRAMQKGEYPWATVQREYFEKRA